MPRFEDPEQQTATVNGVRLGYRVGGQGEPVLLWHGFLGTSYTWRRVVPLLLDTHTVVIPDMRGYGDSQKPAHGYDARTLYTDFQLLLRTLNLGAAHIVAHDMGAPPALLWAAEHPDEVRSLTYLDEPVITTGCLEHVFAFNPTAWKQQHGALWWWSMAFASDMAERLIIGHESEFSNWFYENYCAVPGAVDENDAREYLRSFGSLQGVSGAFGVYRGILETMEQTDSALARGKLFTPVLALGGEKSLGARARTMMETAAAHVTGGAVPGCGHFIPEEKPGELVRLWREFIQKV